MDGTVDEVVTQLGTRAHVAVVIDPTAHAIANCARVRVSLPSDLGSTQLADVANAGVRSLGMIVSAANGTWVVSQPFPARGALPRECFGRSGVTGVSGADPARPFGSLTGGSGGILTPSMPAPPPAPSPLPIAGNVGSGSADAGGAIATLAAGITRRSDTEFDLTPAAREAFFASLSDFTRTVRIIPASQNGVVSGIRMYGIRDGSPMSLIGFRNGDELQRVNGIDIASPDRALEVYSRVRSLSTCTVQIVRQGFPIEIHYRVGP